ncbi:MULTISPECIES: heavy-metal-associated domain-containing protein [Alphaproteobacteria]|uniref:Heavy metal transporter n=2 Tax=Alphaproteobacteria TaxID=28211 RepID=A0A512HFZ1_9HYPH|nr:MULTISPECIES: heavy-metal-associated domain-containing protein [Alphaproteobacteria]GEO84366.1 heavy metal transporter [Ciceribacter naphthalenivorans]GLR24903.1 heavy metal transporter [Ciceribacter naphthalenivorans]GLT07759.1 heavy metal transporter [Sphingomonas psychrolutea]
MSVTNLFQVEDMTCGHCEKAITKALAEALPGAAVTIDLKTHEVTVAGDAEKAEEAIREAGYTPVRKSA